MFATQKKGEKRKKKKKKVTRLVEKNILLYKTKTETRISFVL